MKHLEDAEQTALFDWAKHYPVLDWLFAVPNGGKRNKFEAARLKRQGVKAGVYDVFLPVPVKPYAGLWIEMKRPDGKGRLTDNQRSFGAAMAIAGYKCEVCNGAKEAIQAIKMYANIK